MDLRTAFSLSGSGRLALLWRVSGLLEPFYRMSFVASAASGGLLSRLAEGPRGFDALAMELCPYPDMREGLRAWLDLGVALGELGKGPEGYRLEGALSRELARAANEDVAALVEEVTTFHRRLIEEAPRRMKEGRPWEAREHDAGLIARSSRILEPFLFGALDEILPVSGSMDLLDVGCGSGAYLTRAAARNKHLRAVGIERSKEVADAARAEVRRRGLDDRVTVETGDFRDIRRDGSFDVVVLLNAIYYFPVHERPEVVGRLASFLRPGGRLLIATSCRGGSEGMCVLDLWCSSTVGLGALPTREQLAAQLRGAGLSGLRVTRAIPGEEYFVFSARRGS